MRLAKQMFVLKLEKVMGEEVGVALEKSLLKAPIIKSWSPTDGDTPLFPSVLSLESKELRLYDVILGALWMKTLGLVTMDFTELIMIFNYQGKHYVLKGVDENYKLASSKAMNKLHGDEVDYLCYS
ncbi:hypothetical protein HAX54_042595 [Datura stramonium]|uniref:Uncharacterized protein n=1 Tax=Datura stramonium TaxID=4076 RepID=A0ABS8RNT6_DATST|nr:hypothetical protein [Datura stramonium]